MAAAKIQVFYNLEKFTGILADVFSQRVAAGVTNYARKFVRKDTTNLTNQIRTVPVGPGEYVSEVEETYALAQEYGRTDLPRYGFTSYMRPAADEVTRQSNLDQYFSEAQEGALNRSKL
jgi:hypothetical protein